jgi:hypothetical protein
MTSTQRLTTGPADGAARATGSPPVADRLAVRSGRLRDQLHDHLLRDHLLRDHGRTAGELDGLPVAYLHHFEHVEQAMGLTELGHRHADRGQPGSIDPVSR